jgi:putative membrane protein insertion efficiency factor
MLERVAIGLVRGYRLVLSPMLWFLGSRCRHEPSCSAYAEEALRTHSLPRALALTAGRLVRCHPWGTHGYDPVPPPREPIAKAAGRR